MPNPLSRRELLQWLIALPAGISGARAAGCLGDEIRPGGISRVTRGPADLVVPRDGDGFRYGTGYLFQASPTQAGVLSNLRTEGFPVGDFEAGVDAILFDDPAKISAAEPVPLTRTVKYADRVSGAWRIVIKHGCKGGFVPLGARRADGKPHPHAGTGFTFCEALDFPMKGNGYYDKRDKGRGGMLRTTEVQQLKFDGQRFEVLRVDTYTDAKPLQVPGSPWKITCPALRMGIPAGDDLLFAVTCTSGDAGAWFSDPHVVGVSRWRRVEGQWRPVEFHPVVTSRPAAKPRVVHGRKMSVQPMEPTLIRDTGGSLLFTARLAYETFDEHALRVWRSDDDGRQWTKVIERPDTKGQAPVSIARATDGTPYLVSNPFGRERDRLVLWPLNAARTGVEEPILARDALEQFGPPPGGPVWFMDHANAGVVRLADGRWHNLLVYRIMDRGEHSGKAPPPQSGLYVEEVFSTGPEVGPWRFADG
jgi:hypothetical protein